MISPQTERVCNPVVFLTPRVLMRSQFFIISDSFVFGFDLSITLSPLNIWSHPPSEGHFFIMPWVQSEDVFALGFACDGCVFVVTRSTEKTLFKKSATQLTGVLSIALFIRECKGSSGSYRCHEFLMAST